jgi:hypothetical protein
MLQFNGKIAEDNFEALFGNTTGTWSVTTALFAQSRSD